MPYHFVESARWHDPKHFLTQSVHVWEVETTNYEESDPLPDRFHVLAVDAARAAEIATRVVEARGGDDGHIIVRIALVAGAYGLYADEDVMLVSDIAAFRAARRDP